MVADIRGKHDWENPEPLVYSALLQNYNDRGFTLLAKTDGGPETFTPQLRQEVVWLDSTLQPWQLSTLEEIWSASLSGLTTTLSNFNAPMKTPSWSSFVLLLLCTAPAVRGADAPDQGSSSQSGWRAALREEVLAAYKAQEWPSSATSVPPEPAVFIGTPGPISTDDDVVVLEPMTVIGVADMRGFERAMEREGARHSAVKRRFGTGVLYQRDFGKVRVGVFSVFYIPLAAGLSW